MYEDSYLAECHLAYCPAAAEKAWNDAKYSLAAFYEGIELFWSVMYGTHGGF